MFLIVTMRNLLVGADASTRRWIEILKSKNMCVYEFAPYAPGT